MARIEIGSVLLIKSNIWPIVCIKEKRCINKQWEYVSVPVVADHDTDNGIVRFDIKPDVTIKDTFIVPYSDVIANIGFMDMDMYLVANSEYSESDMVIVDKFDAMYNQTYKDTIEKDEFKKYVSIIKEDKNRIAHLLNILRNPVEYSFNEICKTITKRQVIGYINYLSSLI